MPSTRTRLLLAAATLLSGILAGSVVDRVVVGGPAWHELGAEAWAAYSRQADLGNGLAAYPIEAIGGAILILAAAVSHYFDRDATFSEAIPLYCAVLLSLATLALTVKAAPIMLSLAVPQSAAAIRHAFDEFFLWGLYLRGATVVLTFVAVTWSLCRLEARPRQCSLIGDIR
jgi:hypothetical protein